MNKQAVYFDCCSDKCKHGWIDPHQEVDRLDRIITNYRKERDHTLDAHRHALKLLDETNKTYENRMLQKQLEYDLLVKELIILKRI